MPWLIPAFLPVRTVETNPRSLPLLDCSIDDDGQDVQDDEAAHDILVASHFGLLKLNGLHVLRRRVLMTSDNEPAERFPVPEPWRKHQNQEERQRD